MSKVVRLPGQEEADAIAQDMQIAKQGVVAWVRAGLRLADVKARLPHGQFMKWCNSNFQRLEIWKPSHMFAAKRVAEAIITHIEKENRRTYNLDELVYMLESPDGQLAKIIDGKSTRQLTLDATEPKVLDAEQAAKESEAKAWCEERWQKNPEWQDEYEPRVLSGELTYLKAKIAMTGRETTLGLTRNDTHYADLLEKNFDGAKRHFSQFDKLDPQSQERVIEAAIRMAESCPPRIAAVLRKLLPAE